MAGNVRITLWRTSYAVVFRRYGGPLTFTPENWNVPQTVTLKAVHDDDARDGAVVLTHAASGGGYGGVPPVTLQVKVADDDEVGMPANHRRRRNRHLTVALGTRPAGNVRITL